MFLYHGTSAEYLEQIKEHGIQPRAKSKVKSNWTATVSSNRNAVYLTTAYPWHFAAAASKDRGLILEIDQAQLIPPLLCPDEDFLEQGSQKVEPNSGNGLAPLSWSMKKRTMHYRKTAKFNPHLATLSLEKMGTAAYYDTIPWSAVTRYVIIDWKKLDPSMRLRAIDSQVSILNYMILQDRHKAFTHWLFGDPVEPGELTGNKFYEVPDSGDLQKWMLEQDTAMAAVIKNRDGLTVVNNKVMNKPEEVYLEYDNPGSAF